MSAVAVRPLTENDRFWVEALARERWGGTIMVTQGQVHDLGTAAGFIGTYYTGWVGFAAYRIAKDGCELLLLDSMNEGKGVGTALIAAVAEAARTAGCARRWLITTDDNTRAPRFYQRRGFRLAALHRDAIAAARLLKPSIPLLCDDAIPIRDELELELPLDLPPGTTKTAD